MLPLQARVNLRAMAMEGYSIFPKSPVLQEPHHQWGGGLHLCREAVGVFYSVHPTGQNILLKYNVPAGFVVNFFYQTAKKKDVRHVFLRNSWDILRSSLERGVCRQYDHAGVFVFVFRWFFCRLFFFCGEGFSNLLLLATSLVKRSKTLDAKRLWKAALVDSKLG